MFSCCLLLGARAGVFTSLGLSVIVSDTHTGRPASVVKIGFFFYLASRGSSLIQSAPSLDRAYIYLPPAPRAEPVAQRGSDCLLPVKGVPLRSMQIV